MDSTTENWAVERLVTMGGESSRAALEERCRTAARNFESYRTVLSRIVSPETFRAMLEDLEELTRLTARLSAHAQLKFAEDTQSAGALEMLTRSNELSAEISNTVLFFSQWWKQLDESEVGWLSSSTEEFAYYLTTLRRFAPHTLSEAEEKIVALKNVNGISALVTLYDTITNGLSFELEVDGEFRTMSREELSVFVRDPNANLRAAAYQEMYQRVYRSQESVLEQIYRHRVRDWHTEQVKLRGFASPVAVRNLENDVSDETVATLLDVCRANRGVFQSYFTWKADVLGLPKLRRYDLYAPLGSSPQRSYGFDEAVELVLESFHDFSPEFAILARRVLDDRHIDSGVRPGKRGGAFCYGVLPGQSPYVLVNFTGTPRDVATLAHELGHAVHALLASDHPCLTFHAPLPLAETASVFCELLLTERLLQREKDPLIQRELLCSRLEDAYATVMRQAYFTMFETDAHARIARSAGTGTLNDLYMDNLREQFGDAVELADEFCREWISIPHIFHVPFYCYAYSFGQMLVLALFSQYQEEGRAFVPRLRSILAAGGSACPETVLREAGIDVRKASFWESGFRILQAMIDSLEET